MMKSLCLSVLFALLESHIVWGAADLKKLFNGLDFDIQGLGLGKDKPIVDKSKGKKCVPGELTPSPFDGISVRSAGQPSFNDCGTNQNVFVNAGTVDGVDEEPDLFGLEGPYRITIQAVPSEGGGPLKFGGGENLLGSTGNTCGFNYKDSTVTSAVFDCEGRFGSDFEACLIRSDTSTFADLTFTVSQTGKDSCDEITATDCIPQFIRTRPPISSEPLNGECDSTNGVGVATLVSWTLGVPPGTPIQVTAEAVGFTIPTPPEDNAFIVNTNGAECPCEDGFVTPNELECMLVNGVTQAESQIDFCFYSGNGPFVGLTDVILTAQASVRGPSCEFFGPVEAEIFAPRG